MGRATLVTKTSKCKTCSKAAKSSREVTGTPDGQEQTNAKDPEKQSKIDSGWGWVMGTTNKYNFETFLGVKPRV